MDKHKQTNIEEYLVYEDKQKQNTLKTTLSVRPTGAYLSLIGVDTPELLEAFKNYLLTFKNTKLFHYKSEQIIDEIISLNEKQTLIIDIYNLKDGFKIENIIQSFRFNRDFIPDKNIRIFIIASNDTLDKFSQKAYDFVTFANFYGKFKNNKFDFKYTVNREKLEGLITGYKSLKANTPKKVRIQKMIQVVVESSFIGDNNTALKYLELALLKVKKSKNTQEQAAIYTSFGVFYTDVWNFYLAKSYFEKALNISVKLNDKINEANLLIHIGNVYGKAYKNDIALDYYEKSYRINKFINNKIGLIHNYMAFGAIYRLLGKLDNSFENYKRALKYFDDLDTQGQAKLLSNIAVLYANKLDFNMAIEYIEKANEIAIKKPFTHIIMTNLLNKGIYYKNLLNFDLAIKYLNESFDMCKIFNYEREKKIIEYHISEIKNIHNATKIKTIKIPNKNSEDKEDIVKYLIYEGNNFKKDNNFKESKIKLDEAQNLADEINLKGSQCEVYMAFYDYYKTINDEKNAQSYYNKANYIIKNSGHKLFEKRLENIKKSHTKS
jgi:tetratricopeptide (TPR) repeat protein